MDPKNKQDETKPETEPVGGSEPLAYMASDPWPRPPQKKASKK